MVEEIGRLVPDPDDGVRIDLDTIRSEIMREDAEYHGIRVKLVALLAKARIPFALDFSFGDPGAATWIELPSLIDSRPPVRLRAYPFTLNLAEKIVTAMQRRETSTRDRDFADLWVASRRHALNAGELRGHVVAVAAHRDQPLMTMTEALRDMPDRQSPYAAMVQRMSYRTAPPASWIELLADVAQFVDPLLAPGHEDLAAWDPQALRWT